MDLQAAEVGQNCTCFFALLPSIFLWPLLSSWPQLFTDGYWNWDALEGVCTTRCSQAWEGCWSTPYGHCIPAGRQLVEL